MPTKIFNGFNVMFLFDRKTEIKFGSDKDDEKSGNEKRKQAR